MTTETYRRDGKQELGMGDCQLRSGQDQTRHMHLVMLAYSLLMTKIKQSRAKSWALRRLNSIGQACRAVAEGTLRTTLQWAIEQVTEKTRRPQHNIAQLGLNWKIAGVQLLLLASMSRYAVQVEFV